MSASTPISRLAIALLGPTTLACVLVPGYAVGADEDPKQYVVFVEDFSGNCVSRNGVQLLVKSSHPSRKLRVWLDRYHMGVGTGDRSRSDLAPAGEPEALGCSRSTSGAQEWRVVRAVWID